jgi:hypothetical protein
LSKREALLNQQERVNRTEAALDHTLRETRKKWNMHLALVQAAKEAFGHQNIEDLLEAAIKESKPASGSIPHPLCDLRRLALQPQDILGESSSNSSGGSNEHSACSAQQPVLMEECHHPPKRLRSAHGQDDDKERSLRNRGLAPCGEGPRLPEEVVFEQEILSSLLGSSEHPQPPGGPLAEARIRTSSMQHAAQRQHPAASKKAKSPEQ